MPPRSRLLLFFLLLTMPFRTFSITEDLKKGDELYSKRQDITNVYKALSLYEKHLDEKPESIEALWRASMAHYYIGHLADKKNSRMDHYKKGVAQGERCTALSSSGRVECLFWLGTNLALLKKEKGIFSLVFGISDLISTFEKSLKVDSSYAAAGPYRMLALLYYKAPGFLGGNSKKAYQYIKEAIKMAPNEPLNYYFYCKFINEDKGAEEALKIVNSFLKKANSSLFSFYESINAYQKLQYFSQHKDWPASDD